MKVPLCKVEEIPDAGTKTATFFEREVLVLKIEGKMKVYLNVCPHLGGSLRREGDKLICQSHNSEFDCRNGQCLSGPAHPQSQLLRIPTFVEDGVLTYAADFDYQEGAGFTQILPILIRQNNNI
ncbi:MAG: Rieske 2Fe-2S domain-containing protein [Chloroflexi bacterium]|nr:Rieske 2Fe-2S domain-containing protein [Chloroflexota bacterium]